MTDFEKYQLEWMIDHDHSLNELIELLAETAEEQLGIYEQSIEEAYDIFTNEIGFNDGMWANKVKYENTRNLG